MRLAAAMETDSASLVLPGIVERHAQQAAFLWHQRDAAVRSAAYDLKSLLQLDDRLEAHIDGLRIAGDVGWQICKDALSATPGGGEMFLATVLATLRSDVRAVGDLLALGVGSRDLARGMVSALGWLPIDQADRYLTELVADDAAIELRYFGIAGSAAHRRDPGEALAAAARADDPRIRARALRAIGEIGRADLLPALRDGLEADDQACRFWAAWSAALLGEPAAIEVLWALTREAGPLAERASRMAARCTEVATARAQLRDIGEASGSLRAAVAGAAALGDAALIPWLIDCMAVAEHARFAAWAFSTITGVALDEQRLSGLPPPGFRSGPTDDPRDPDVSPDPDAGLPWPDAGALRSWWERKRTGFPPGRLLFGKPIERPWLGHVLRAGPQPARAAAAIEMAILRRGQPLFEVRAPADRQAEALSEEGASSHVGS